ncbi:ribosomal protein S5 domain 2-type protein [Xylariales sp. AK1849]|nr:ribosomal protein S5 domain 2-type protein [Xylariales sp. AK1849]
MDTLQVFGNKKAASAVAHAKQSKGLIRINGQPLAQYGEQVLRSKSYEPLLILGLQDFSPNVDTRVRVAGGGRVKQVYAVHQALAKAIIASFVKYAALVQFDRTLLVADSRPCEPK